MTELQNAQDDALEAQLQSQADIERKAADDAEKIAQQNYDDMRAGQRQNLENMLSDLQTALDNGTISWGDALGQVKKLITDNVGDFATLGGMIGDVFMQQLLQSITDAGTASGPVAAALNQLKKLGYRWNPDTQQWEPIPKGTGTGTLPAAPPGSSGNCFVAGTMVWTPTGVIAIEKLEVGDKVLAWEFATSRFVETRVSQATSHTVDAVLDLEIREGPTITVSPEHPFWSNGEWRPVRELRMGDTVSVRDGEILREAFVESLDAIAGERGVYNLHVEHPDHCYLAEGVLVHNKVYTGAKGFLTLGRKPITALLHGPEAVVPLESPIGRQILGGGGGGAAVYNLHFYSPVGAPASFAQDLRRELIRIQKKNTHDILGRP